MKAIIVDDEKHVREGLILLADWAVHGIDTVMEAEDGEEAVELIQKHRPEIIFTDMRMPKRDGISLLKWIHTAGIRSKTSVVSGHDDAELRTIPLAASSFFAQYTKQWDMGLAALVLGITRMPACHAGGRGFESRPDRHFHIVAQGSVMGKFQIGRASCRERV